MGKDAENGLRTYQRKKRKSGLKTYQRKKRNVGNISIEKSSGSCSDGEPASEKSKNGIEMETLKQTPNEDVFVTNGSVVDLLDEISEEGNGSKINIVPNAMKRKVGNISVEKSSGGCSDGEPASEKSKKRIEMETLTQTPDEDVFVNNGSVVDLLDENSEEGNGSEINIVPNEVKKDAMSGLRTYQRRKVGNISVEKSSGCCSDGEPASENDASLVINKDDRSMSSPERSVACHIKRKLLILDVNGVLADIVQVRGQNDSTSYEAHSITGDKAIFRRPFCDEFLQFCFEKFNVGVWSSRTKKNLEPVLDILLGKTKNNLLFCWDQSHCTDTGFGTVAKREKPMLLKQLKKLWENHEQNLPWGEGEYNESNTLLLDDSSYKALCNPPCTAIFPYAYKYKDVKDNSLGPGGDLRVYLEGLALAENVQNYVGQNPFGQRPIRKSNLSWAFYLKVINAVSPEAKKWYEHHH